MGRPDAASISSTCPSQSNPFTAQGKLYVFEAKPPSGGPSNPPIWSKTFAAKIDSGPPAIVDLDPNDHRDLKQIVFGGWDGRLHVVWHAGGKTVARSLSLLKLDASLPADTNPVMRTSPLIADFRNTAVFGWMPDWTKDQDARLSAVDIRVDTVSRTVTFHPRWTPKAKVVDTWKSSPTLVPAIAGSAGEDQPLAVQGYGIDPAPGPFVTCGDVFGGVIAVRPDGSTKWNFELPKGYGRGTIPLTHVLACVTVRA